MNRAGNPNVLHVHAASCGRRLCKKGVRALLIPVATFSNIFTLLHRAMLLLLAFAALAAGHAAKRPHLVFLLADDQVRLRSRSIANGIKRCSKKLKKM